MIFTSLRYPKKSAAKLKEVQPANLHFTNLKEQRVRIEA